MKFLKQFFTKHPELRTQYVDTSIVALNYLAKPLDLFMQHLLTVQEIDPQTKPGSRYQAALAESLNKTHEKDFDDNYDFSWIRKSFQKTQNALPNLNMTPAQYHRATDIGSLQSPPAKEDKFFTEAAQEDTLRAVTDPTFYPTTEENQKLIDRDRKSLPSSILDKMQRYVDSNRDSLNKEDRAVQLEKKDPSEFKELVAAIKKYGTERAEENNAVRTFKKMVDEAEEAVEAPALPAISLKEALQTIVKLAKTVETSGPVSKFVKHRDGNTLIRNEEVNKGFIKRFPK
jgi:hypothetical protein